MSVRRRTRGRLVAVVVSALAVAGCGRGDARDGSSRRGDDRPNVVLIVVDTLGADAVGSYGGAPGLTPSIDRIASEGVRFRAVSVAPWTAPTLRSLLTSTYPSEHGFGSRWKLLESVPTLAETLTAAGYRTAAFLDADAPPLEAGFETYECLFCRPEVETRRPHENLAPRPFALARAWIAAEADRPFFVFIQTYEAHDYFFVKPYQRAIADRALPDYRGAVREWEPVLGEVFIDQLYAEQLANPDSARYLQRLYQAGVAAADAEVGRFDEALQAMGRRADTIVVVAGDHGEGFDAARGRLHHGGRLHDDLLRVPLVIRWPARIAPAAPETRVSLLDVMPTLLGLAGVPIPSGVRGLPLFRTGSSWRSWFGLAPPPVVAADVPERDLLAEESVYFVGPDGRRETSTVHQFALYALGSKLLYSPESVALYDLDADPGEAGDLAGTRPHVVEAMRGRLGRLVQSLGTPSAVPDPDVLQVLRSLGYIR